MKTPCDTGAEVVPQRVRVKSTAVLNVAIGTPRAFPHCSITVAQFIVKNLGTGGHAFVRSCYLDTFYYAARSSGHRIEAKECVHGGALMHRITRLS